MPNRSIYCALGNADARLCQALEGVLSSCVLSGVLRGVVSAHSGVWVLIALLCWYVCYAVIEAHPTARHQVQPDSNVQLSSLGAELCCAEVVCVVFSSLGGCG